MKAELEPDSGLPYAVLYARLFRLYLNALSEIRELVDRVSRLEDAERSRNRHTL